ncbi:flavin reductase (DIM6/NTAB) family NADH-FMN oxidoreductase RutF [Nocardia pseudobrasiliensis]|uniref:Flavin reductase (DIM6/NTAB) family NADH-FMN oxidoreductase RutF n=2 Tax=Nocardia pseudobrasiliensis TaxID=45979 RepID=A0A370I7E9_9NOCA|nr:flavin reductase (DIM6/NTAB) family NADH-FMN oxidoreductase RutF [Nocardia pseudobrasiliensis]
MSDRLRAPDDLSGITATQFRAAMRHYPAGVTIVTLGSAIEPIGFTATSFASLSAEPPLISFNIAHTSSSIEAMLAADSVVVHFLGEHQQHLAQRFSRSAEERFADHSLWTTLDTGEPVLHGTPLWVRATVFRLIPIGDHTLVIGLVTRVFDNTDDQPIAAPLLYYNGAYHRPTGLE